MTTMKATTRLGDLLEFDIPELVDFLAAVANTDEHHPHVYLDGSGQFGVCQRGGWSGNEVWRWNAPAGSQGVEVAAMYAWNEGGDELELEDVTTEHIDAYVDHWREDLDDQFVDGIEKLEAYEAALSA